MAPVNKLNNANMKRSGTNTFVKPSAANGSSNFSPPPSQSNTPPGGATTLSGPTAATITAPAYSMDPVVGSNTVFVDRQNHQRYAMPTYAVDTNRVGGASRMTISADTSDPNHSTWILTVYLNITAPASGAQTMGTQWLKSPTGDNLITLYIPAGTVQPIEHSAWAPDPSTPGIYRADFPIADRTTCNYLMSAMFKPDVNSGTNAHITFAVRFKCAIPVGAPDSAGQQHFLDDQPVQPSQDLDLWVGPAEQNDILQDPSLKSGGGTTPGTTGTGLSRVTVPGDSNSYFQDLAAQQNFFYLPDAFKILRDPNSPHYPWMRLTVSGQDMDNLTATLTYTAMPVIDADRKEAAKRQLQSRVPGNQTFTFNPLPPPVKKPRFMLALPGGDSGPVKERTGVDVSLVNGFQDVIVAPLSDITAIFNSLGDAQGAYFQGNVLVTIADGVPEVQIPFVARASDFVGDIFDVEHSVDPQSGAFLLKITNAIESVIHIDTMPVNLQLGDVNIPCTVTADPLMPVDLNPKTLDQPADSLTLTVLPQGGPNSTTYNIDCDLRATTVVFDKDALLQAIMTDTPAATKRDVLVKIPVSTFGAASLPPNKRLSAVQISFERNGDVTLYATDKPDATQSFVSNTITLKASLLDAILNTGSNIGSYRYKVKKIYADGHADAPSDWIPDSQSTLFVGLT